MSNKISLCMFTSEFPFGMSETFIENELPILAKKFKCVYIFPLFGFDKDKRKLPENVRTITLNTHYRNKSVIFKDAILFASLSRKINKIDVYSFTEKKDWITRIIHLLNIKYELDEWIKQQKETSLIYYSYWFDDWSRVLAMLKKQKKIPSFISRAHGFDVYSEMNNKSVMPLQNFQLDQVKKVYVVSKFGKQYMQKNNRKYSSKIEYSPLGTIDKYEKTPKPNQVFTMVSCSTINKVKRLSLIIKALHSINLPVCWIHFGDGPLEREIKEQAGLLPPNIEVNFKGRVSNDELLNYYKNNAVELLVNVSKSEGLPVSIMEAISFGIPVIATDVGGSSEIVNEDTGILLDKNFDPQELAVYITNSIKNNILPASEAVRSYWKQHFEAEQNFSKFCEILLKNKE